MDPQQFANSPAGKVMKTLQGHWAFVPHPLPPQLQFGNRDITLLSEAERALGKLVGVGDTLPNPQLLIGPIHWPRSSAFLPYRGHTDVGD